MIERLGNVGISALRTRMPQHTDADYDSNDRDVFEFLGIVLGTCTSEQLRYEVLRKFRRDARRHPIISLSQDAFHFNLSNPSDHIRKLLQSCQNRTKKNTQTHITQTLKISRSEYQIIKKL